MCKKDWVKESTDTSSLRLSLPSGPKEGPDDVMVDVSVPSGRGVVRGARGLDRSVPPDSLTREMKGDLPSVTQSRSNDGRSRGGGVGNGPEEDITTMSRL